MNNAAVCGRVMKLLINSAEGGRAGCSQGMRPCVCCNGPGRHNSALSGPCSLLHTNVHLGLANSASVLRVLCIPVRAWFWVCTCSCTSPRAFNSRYPRSWPATLAHPASDPCSCTLWAFAYDEESFYCSRAIMSPTSITTVRCLTLAVFFLAARYRSNRRSHRTARPALASGEI